MADEGASSSSNSVDDVEDKQEKGHVYYVPTCFVSDSCATVTSSGHMGSGNQGNDPKVFLLGKETGNTTSNPFAIKTSQPTRSVADSTENKESRPLLAPPTLKLGNTESPKIVLRPSALSIQAEKLKQLNKHDGGGKQEGKENSSDESNVTKIPRLSTHESNGKISKVELLASGVSTSTDGVAVSSPSKPSSTVGSTFSLLEKNSDDQSSNGGSFIFGQNLHERVVISKTHEQPSSPTDSHNLTFEEAALKKEELEKMERQNQEEKLKKSLTESAREYESKQVKRKFEEVTVITGEEEELNVLQINCKLFAFDKVSMNWQERGRGLLRLNDKECKGTLHSRVVMRIHGSLRVVLNTKVWAGMSVEHPSKKTVRLTAYDPQGVKVFLVMAQPKDAEQLFNALDWRVATLKNQDVSSSKEPSKEDESQSTLEEATSSSPLPDASCEDSCDNSSNKGFDSGCCGADSSSETNFIPHESSGDAVSDGAADSTEIQS
ncbi:ran-binding protein 3 [Trichonephila inaurata madagascariensis]|uniref:Ran-binding protein 3 n=1 Tax=Trichonephila inaurata madagascariensis TaxID=2747483 RepID=A0A8X6WY13_9ARAC|nr:ran-binding protein 3 [Trichonephila inaurata madagascariensis]